MKTPVRRLHHRVITRPQRSLTNTCPLQTQLHQDPEYGVASVHYAPMVAQVIKAVGAHEVLDYGAGKGRLGVALRQHLQQELKIHHYDPAIPEWSAPPAPCSFVACIDVLEHIEPDLLEDVLDDQERVTARVGIFSGAHRTRKKNSAERA